MESCHFDKNDILASYFFMHISNTSVMTLRKHAYSNILKISSPKKKTKKTRTFSDKKIGYTQQNNLRATSFTVPLIITKMRGQNWKSQPYFNQFSMFATCSATKFQWHRHRQTKTTFYPKMNFSQNREISLFNENNSVTTKSCKLNPCSSKRHTDMGRKRGQPFERLKMPRKFP